ncbi:MAG: S26 family signal peptidase [Asticcacaulis sp.]|uniref:S26 family signal peptidase n=1 Tax=Asticcacaulis sp. TaxID=1872648 RepID=UPI0039E6EC0E
MRRVYLTATAIAFGCLALAGRSERPAIIYNPSPSAPLGYYRTLAPTSPARGDWVLITAPDPARELADARGYSPKTVPMIKSVAALGGDRVCAADGLISINGKVVATRMRLDHRGRPMPWWSGCLTLNNNEVFVLNRGAPSSFDGRYFGVIQRQAIRARLVHL